MNAPVKSAQPVDSVRLALTILGDERRAASVTRDDVVALCRTVAALHSGLMLCKWNDRSKRYATCEARPHDGMKPRECDGPWETPKEIAERVFAGGLL